mmetsp:Transcript_4169/g.14975  ORF Transcript_4169/g.14975 Transcript_4169/m.14975 type:complete len:625 (-) Transcript_4169:591-2465(-)
MSRVPGLRDTSSSESACSAMCHDGCDSERGVIEAAQPPTAAVKITLLHFNDVYNVEGQQGNEPALRPTGGAAKFATALRQVALGCSSPKLHRGKGEGDLQEDEAPSIQPETPDKIPCCGKSSDLSEGSRTNEACETLWRTQQSGPLVVFSGDAFNPSFLSIFTQGRHMPPILNELGVCCACVGNHDLDFGVNCASELFDACQFPWLMANIVDKRTGKHVKGTKATHVVDVSGVRLALVGLVESDWISTLASTDQELLQYTDFVECGRTLARTLKASGVDVVVACTHMRLPNDMLLADTVPEIDLVLAGHDHDYLVARSEVTNTLVVKSGTDFREFSEISLTLSERGGYLRTVQCVRHEVDEKYDADPTMLSIVGNFTASIDEQMCETIGATTVPLDARFSIIRTQESNVGNLVADLMVQATGAQVALLNSGSIRSDCVLPPGSITFRDLVRMLPFDDPLVVLEVRGWQLLAALERAVGGWPRLEGRFLQVSGLRFAFDVRASTADASPETALLDYGERNVVPKDIQGRTVAASLALSRVSEDCVFIQSKKIDMMQTYSVVCRAYIAQGGDGFHVLKGCPRLVPAQQGPNLRTIVRNHLQRESVTPTVEGRIEHLSRYLPPTVGE